MAVKKTKTLAAVATVTNVTAQQFIPLTDENGSITKVSLASLKAALIANLDLDAIEDGIFIAYHNAAGDTLMVKPHKWAALQGAGNIAAGVVVLEGGKLLMIAPTETILKWSKKAVAAGGTTTTSNRVAIADLSGEASTAVQVTHAECQSGGYAPGYCKAYGRGGQGAGSWWLPALGEIEMIYANMKKINYALSLINGATLITENWYWASTETDTNAAWAINLTNGFVGSYVKASYQNRVRPVSTFI